MCCRVGNARRLCRTAKNQLQKTVTRGARESKKDPPHPENTENGGAAHVIRRSSSQMDGSGEVLLTIYSQITSITVGGSIKTNQPEAGVSRSPSLSR